MQSLSFRVQKINEDSDTVIMKNGRILTPFAEEAQEMNRTIARVSLKGTKLVSDENVSVFYRNLNFYAEIPTIEKDHTNRNSIIGILGTLPSRHERSLSAEEWLSDVIKEIKEFTAKVINRTIREENLLIIEEGLDMAWKKSNQSNKIKQIVQGILFLISPLLIGWIIKQIIPHQPDSSLQPVLDQIIVIVSLMISLNNVLIILFFRPDQIK